MTRSRGGRRALRERERFREEGSLEGWVWRIAFRVAIDERRGGREVAFERTGAPEPERDPELANALRRLSPRRRLVVFLRRPDSRSASRSSVASPTTSQTTTTASGSTSGGETTATTTTNADGATDSTGNGEPTTTTGSATEAAQTRTDG